MFAPDARPLLEAAPTPSHADEPTLDQLLAEPIVQQLMRRDQTEEATVRDLLREIATARLASRANDGRRDYSENDVAEILERVRTWPPKRRQRAAEALIALENAEADEAAIKAASNALPAFDR